MADTSPLTMFSLSSLHLAVIVTMIAMRVVHVVLHEVIDMIAMVYRGVTTIRSMDMVGIMSMTWRTGIWIKSGY